MNLEDKYNIYLGGGVDGNCYKYDDDKFIKFSKHDLLENLSNKIDKILFIIKNPQNHFVKICHLHNDNDKYYYVGELLNNISDDEYRVFHTLISHEDCNKIKNIEVNHIKLILNDLKHYYSFDYNKIIEFIELINSSKIKHLDMHPRNIMKDNLGNFKFIDIERISYE